MAFTVLSQWAESLAEQSAVALGLLSAEEVADDADASTSELVRRFSVEACALKNSAMNGPVNRSIFGCGATSVEDKSLRSGMTGAEIDETLQRWVKRLASDGELGPAALDALLQSMALQVALQAMLESAAGVETIHSAEKSRGLGEAASPLWKVLQYTSAAPEELLEQLLQLLAQSADMKAKCHEKGVGDFDVLKQLEQWTLSLLCASMRDASELALCKRGQPAEIFDGALLAIAASEKKATSVPVDHRGLSRQLEPVESLGQLFQGLKALCEDLIAAKKAPPKKKKKKKDKEPESTESTESMTFVGDDLPAQTLSATLESLSSLWKANPARANMTDKERAFVNKVQVASSMEVKHLLEARRDRVEKISKGLQQLPSQLEKVSAACLDIERLRRRRVEEFLSSLQKIVWGDDSQSRLARDTAEIAGLREVIKRAIALVDSAWREMVNIAAETLDDSNAIGASSEEMSGAAAHYKNVRQELQKSLARLKKLEDDGPRLAPPSPPKKSPPSPGPAAQRQSQQKASVDSQAAPQAPAPAETAEKRAQAASQASAPSSAEKSDEREAAVSKPVTAAPAAPKKDEEAAADARKVPETSAVASKDQEAVTAAPAVAKSDNSAREGASSPPRFQAEALGKSEDAAVVVTVRHTSSVSIWEAAVSPEIAELRGQIKNMTGGKILPALVLQASDVALKSGASITVESTDASGNTSLLYDGVDAAAAVELLRPLEPSAAPCQAAAPAVSAAQGKEDNTVVLKSLPNVWEAAVCPQVSELRERLRQELGAAALPAVVLQPMAMSSKSSEACAMATSDAASGLVHVAPAS
eukprot:TRINITY_DN29042_c0_g2_i2.p1 TRINITY_DN29042_c0_g2~~TRINITY_DN29042_c0_g2_i2.p1  ORF type:complete len:829 (+),score=210.87 TRINITY_DN29042_c0_g2_i2:35-2488(+)